MKKQTSSVAILLFATVLWGASYVVQRVGGDAVGAFTMNSLRGFIGAAALLPVILLRRKGLTRDVFLHTLKVSVGVGLMLAAATIFQQLGIMNTSVGKAGFITSLHIVIVPVLCLMMGRKGSAALWIGVAMSLAGLFLLCFRGGEPLNLGDIIAFLGAVCFSVHMLMMEKHSNHVNLLLFSAIQFLICGIVSAFPMVLVEKPTLAQLEQGWVAIVYAGVIALGLGATLQGYVQRYLNAATTALIMSTEAVFAALCGWIFLHERMQAVEIAGAALILGATLLVQIPGLLASGKKA